MASSTVEKIADAVLYEGYILYPYRPALKNRQRWTFGGLYPRSFCEAEGGSESCSMRTECLVRGAPDVQLDVTVRFLHLIDRTAGQLAQPLAHWPDDHEPEFHAVDMLRVGDTHYPSWQEAVERRVEVAGVSVGDVCATTGLPARASDAPERADRPIRREEFCFPGARTVEPICGRDGEIIGVLVRDQQCIAGVVEVAAKEAAEGLFRVSVRICNQTPLEHGSGKSRDELLMRSLVSTHAILHTSCGEFISLIDPPEAYREYAAECENRGAWPVLAGDEGQTDTMLAAPIILYDYPQVAPESPGDLFDGTEIDEILTLRIMTLTDSEKLEMAAVDPRAGQVLERTEALCREQLMNLHGTIRHAKPFGGEKCDG